MEADATALPLSDGSVDVLSASYVLHVLGASDRERAVSEIARVLRPGGRAGVVVPALPRGVLRAPWSAALRVAGEPLGLAVIDAVGELARGGLTVERGRFVRRGYPSHCLLARRDA